MRMMLTLQPLLVMLMPMLTLTLLMKMMMPTLMVLLMLLLTTTVTQMMGSLVSGAEPTSQLEPGGPKYPAREAAPPSARGSCHLARGRGPSHSSEPWLTAD